MLFLVQYLNGDLLDGIYWEESYNNGDDNEYVCPGVQVNIKSYFLNVAIPMRMDLN